ncbi:MAG TPA: hypothetical protein VGC66_11795 [Pyrinomonadaceae bacterium]|jgi:hypothetical protein
MSRDDIAPGCFCQYLYQTENYTSLANCPFFIEPENNLPDYLKTAVDDTIIRLKLNEDDTLIQERANVVQWYADEDVSFVFLEQRYPFIAYELDRQGLREVIKTRLRKKPAS